MRQGRGGDCRNCQVPSKGLLRRRYGGDWRVAGELPRSNGVRDHTRLRVFHEADDLVIVIYRLTTDLPPAERYGLQSQLRRAALSIPTNIVEGAARRSRGEYCRFLEVALGSCRECCYLLSVASRLHLLADNVSAVARRYSELSAVLAAMLVSLRRLSD